MEPLLHQSDAAVEAAARVIDPRAFSGEMLVLGCGGNWHYTGHSSHSVCGCGSSRWDQRWALETKQANAQELAKRIARAVLLAAAEVGS